MTAFHNPLRRGRPDGFAGRMTEIKGWTRAALGLGDEVVVSVSELACGQIGCPPRQTVILVLAGTAPTRKFTFHKAIMDINHNDIALSLVSFMEDG